LEKNLARELHTLISALGGDGVPPRGRHRDWDSNAAEKHPHLAELVPVRLRAVVEAEEGHPLAPE
jgi:hypothetical protein